MGLKCSSAFQGLPASCLDGNGILMPSGLYFTPLNEQFDTLAEAGDNANWDTKIVAGNMTVIHGVKEVENLTADDAVYEATSQDKIFLFPGKISLKFSLYVTVDQHKALLTYNNKKGRMGFYDKASNILGTSPDGAVFKAYKMSYIRVSDLIIPTDASPAFTNVEVQFANNSELNQTLHTIRPYVGTAANKWYPSDLPTLSLVRVVQFTTIAANVAVIDVTVLAPSDTDNDGAQVSAGAIEDLDVLTFLNFLWTDGAGTALVPLSMTESAVVPGRYTGTFTTIVAGADVQILGTVLEPYTSTVLVLA